MNEERKEEAISFTKDDKINRLLSKIVSDIKGFIENQLDQIKRLT